jgi:hypothetical protein
MAEIFVVSISRQNNNTIKGATSGIGTWKDNRETDYYAAKLDATYKVQGKPLIGSTFPEQMTQSANIMLPAAVDRIVKSRNTLIEKADNNVEGDKIKVEPYFNNNNENRILMKFTKKTSSDKKDVYEGHLVTRVKNDIHVYPFEYTPGYRLSLQLYNNMIQKIRTETAPVVEKPAPAPEEEAPEETTELSKSLIELLTEITGAPSDNTIENPMLNDAKRKKYYVDEKMNRTRPIKAVHGQDGDASLLGHDTDNPKSKIKALWNSWKGRANQTAGKRNTKGNRKTQKKRKTQPKKKPKKKSVRKTSKK